MKCTIILFIFNVHEHKNTVSSTAPSNTTPNPDLDYFTTIEAYLLVVSVFLILILLCTILICYRKMWVLFTIIIISNINVLIIFFCVTWVYIVFHFFFVRKKQSKPIQTYAGTYTWKFILKIFDKLFSLLIYLTCSWLSCTQCFWN